MSKGLDTTENCAPHIAALKAEGYTFVARYSSHSAWKNLTPEEAKALSAAGIYLVNVWETGANHEAFFSRAQGLQDGAAAFAFARHIGQPVSAPIYFAVDCDCDPAITTAYFEGLRASLELHGVIGQTVYRVGVYGSGAVCRHLAELGLVSHTWLAQSTGWQGSDGCEDWNLKQLTGTTIAGMQADPDIAAAKGGGGFLVGK